MAALARRGIGATRLGAETAARGVDRLQGTVGRRLKGPRRERLEAGLGGRQFAVAGRSFHRRVTLKGKLMLARRGFGG